MRYFYLENFGTAFIETFLTHLNQAAMTLRPNDQEPIYGYGFYYGLDKINPLVKDFYDEMHGGCCGDASTNRVEVALINQTIWHLVLKTLLGNKTPVEYVRSKIAKFSDAELLTNDERAVLRNDLLKNIKVIMQAMDTKVLGALASSVREHVRKQDRDAHASKAKMAARLG